MMDSPQQVRDLDFPEGYEYPISEDYWGFTDEEQGEDAYREKTIGNL